MAGKQAKILSDSHVDAALKAVVKTRYPARNRTILLFSIKAGLRAGEISKLTWPMVCTPDGDIADSIELYDIAAKKCSGRTIPMHREIAEALGELREFDQTDGPIIRSERNDALSSTSIVNWFSLFYRSLGFNGCTSHSGRRTFITKAARLLHKTGGSLRDIQQLAGHRSIEITQRYIDGHSRAKRALVALL